jgi:two-component system, OmpR family, sensor histidine kinase ArlS
MSIRLRLMLLFTAITAVILGIFSINIYYSTIYIRKAAFVDRLWERSEISARLLRESPNPDLNTIHPSARNTYWTILPDEEIIVYDEHGQHFYINEFVDVTLDYENILDELQIEGRIERTDGKRQVVGLTKKINDQPYYIIVSAFDKNGNRLLNNLRITIISSYLASIILILLGGWLFSRKTFQPVYRIIETAGRISESDLHLRVPIPRGKNELVRLVNTINDSFDRLQKAVEVQKTFVANASHELRTPLTALRGDLELALYKERSNDEYRHFIAEAYEDARQLSRLVNHLLLFAQTNTDRRAFDFFPVRVDEVLMDVAQKLQVSYPERNIEFRFTEQFPDEKILTITANEHLLSVAFTNLIENGLKYSTDAPVQVVIHAVNRLQVQIQDFGMGVSLTDLEHIFVPFYRSKRSSDAEGFGLGLPLTKQIITLHGWDLSIESKLNEGTIATINFSNQV